MGFIKKIINLLAIFSLVVLLYVCFPNITFFVDKVLLEFQKSTAILTDKIAKTDFSNIKGIGSLVDGDFYVDHGYSGSSYIVDSEYYPYYAIISSEYQELYKQILVNALNLNSTFAPICDIKQDEITSIIEAVMYDHPELYYLDNNYSYKFNKDGYVVSIILSFNSLANNLENSRRNFDNSVIEIISVAKTFKSDYEKEKYVHDILVDSINYKEDSQLNQSAYSALVNKESVCAGISRAFQYILTELGIPCYYVVGYSTGNHAWNIVKLDGNYYNIDLTWDNTGNNKYAYFNKSDYDFSTTHERYEMSLKLPSCNSKSYKLEINDKETIDVFYDDLEDFDIFNFIFN